jgi:hypothetical protein
VSRRDNENRGRANWQQSMDDARNNCRQALMQAHMDVSDPAQALWPAVSREAMSNEHRAVAQAHASVLDYVEHIEPYSARCAGIWTKEIAEPYEFEDGSTLPVVLQKLDRWAGMRYVETVESGSELNPRAKSTEVKRVHLPAEHAHQAFKQANRCVKQLKLGADPPTPDRTVDGPEDAW